MANYKILLIILVYMVTDRNRGGVHGDTGLQSQLQLLKSNIVRPQSQRGRKMKRRGGKERKIRKKRAGNSGRRGKRR